MGSIGTVIPAYRQAIQTLQDIRHDVAITNGNRNRRSSFREAVGGLYFELADLCLQRTDSEQNVDSIRSALVEARQTIELLKSVQIEDCFQNDCINLIRTKTQPLGVLADQTAVIYLIPLLDWTELLVGLRSGLERFKVGVGSNELTEKVRAFRRQIGKRISYRSVKHARRLYGWLIQPIESTLASHQVDTLIFVPDGALRTIQLSALMTGKEFLINKYTVVVSSDLTLVEPKTFARTRVRET